MALRRNLEGIDKKKASHEATLANVNGDIVDLGLLKSGEFSAKADAISGRDIADANYRDG